MIKTLSNDEITLSNLRRLFNNSSLNAQIHNDCVILTTYGIIVRLPQKNIIEVIANPDELVIEPLFKIPREAMITEVLKWVNDINGQTYFTRAVCLPNNTSNKIRISLTFDLECSEGIIESSLVQQIKAFINSKGHAIEYIRKELLQLPYKVLTGKIQTGYKD